MIATNLAQASNGVDPAFAAPLFVIHVAAVVICFLKGKAGMGVAGLFSGWFAWIGAIRVAKPDSWWARRYYASNSWKMREAEKRHGLVARRREPPEPPEWTERTGPF